MTHSLFGALRVGIPIADSEHRLGASFSLKVGAAQKTKK